MKTGGKSIIDVEINMLRFADWIGEKGYTYDRERYVWLDNKGDAAFPNSWELLMHFWGEHEEE